VVVSDEEVEHGIACARGHALYELVDEGQDGGIADGDSVEWLEVMDDAECAAFLFDAEPMGSVRSV
jgi:hypothetical protein